MWKGGLVKDLLDLGVDLLITKAKSGELTAENIWLALKGATKYRKAMHKGDVASPELALLRAGMQCAACRTCQQRDTGIERDGGIVLALSCGPLLEEHGGTEPSCGCLVGIRINGRVLPAGKTMVRSEVCPQRKW